MQINKNNLVNPWAGRFTEKMSQQLINFNTSLPLEARLLASDIKASIAHVKMLNKVGLLETEETTLLISELNKIDQEWQNGEIELLIELEDIHMNLEVLLVNRLGTLGKKVHTARSRNDQQAVAQRLYFKETTAALIEAIKKLQHTLHACCRKNGDLIMPSYTHLQKAEFTYFSHWLAAYIVMIDRDKIRFSECLQRADECPLGACASSGTSLPIDRDFTAKLLNFKAPTINSIDSVSDRDYLLEFTAHAAILMVHLSRLSEEIILFVSSEFDYIKLADAYCTGSSIMPQKKNPDILELIRGKTGTVIGNAVSLLALIKNMSLGYNKDLQEDKTAWFSALDNSLASVNIMDAVISTMQVNAKNMLDATRKGHLIATEYANYLVTKGVPFREAHTIIGKLVKAADEKGVDISCLDYDFLKSFSDFFKEDISDISVKSLIDKKNSIGSCGRIAMQRMFDAIEKMLECNV